ncbi:MAG: hypothetical protein IKB50_01495 [Clostridia bacterium]|nr:hypothetical protein [Clostridia bacterium]
MSGNDMNSVVFYLILGCLVTLIYNKVIKNIEKRKIEKAKNQENEELEREIKRLTQCGIVRDVSMAMRTILTERISNSIHWHIQNYGYRPEKISDIWRPTVGAEIDSHGFYFYGSVEFQKLGYCNLQEEIQKKALGCAVERWSKEWVFAEPRLHPDKKYWEEYTKNEIDRICTEKGIPSLKRI